MLILSGISEERKVEGVCNATIFPKEDITGSLMDCGYIWKCGVKKADVLRSLWDCQVFATIHKLFTIVSKCQMRSEYLCACHVFMHHFKSRRDAYKYSKFQLQWQYFRFFSHENNTMYSTHTLIWLILYRWNIWHVMLIILVTFSKSKLSACAC